MEAGTSVDLVPLEAAWDGEALPIPHLPRGWPSQSSSFSSEIAFLWPNPDAVDCIVLTLVSSH